MSDCYQPDEQSQSSCCASKAQEGDTNTIHIAIIGTGSGAFAAATKATERGARVSIIEAEKVIGGTCVNIGCVPSKIFIRAANIAHIQSRHGFEGVAFNTPVINRKAMVAQQQGWVNKLRYAKYQNILENNPAITLIRGQARFSDANTLLVDDGCGSETSLQADCYLIAVGARPMIPEIAGLAGTPYWTSTEALIAEDIPKHLLVLGGSVVAIELAQAFVHLGAKVTLMARSSLLSREDAALGESLQGILAEEGVKLHLHTVPDAIEHDEGGFTVTAGQRQIRCDRLLVATGRGSNADTLALHNTDVQTDDKGKVIIDDYLQTHAAHIYAVGDCTNQPQYVYVAAAAGTRAGRNMTGDRVALDLSVMPAVVFSEPQVATVGWTEQQAIRQGIKVESRTLALENVPRAIANMDTRGFIKLVVEAESGRILGCQILAHGAGEVIQTAALAMHNRMTVDELADQLFPYLTMVEGLKLTAQTFRKDVGALSCCAG